MKKRLLFLATVSMIAILMLSIAAQAASSDKYVAEVNSKKYTSITSAWEDACDSNGTINMLADWSVAKSDDLIITEDHSVTLNMNGHMLEFQGVATEFGYTGTASKCRNGIIIEDNAVLTVNGGEATAHPCYLRSNILFPTHWDPNNKYFEQINVYGGFITGCFVDSGGAFYLEGEKARLILDNVTVAGNANTSYYHSCAAIYMDDEDQTLELNSCNICYNYSGNNGAGIYVNEENANIILDGTSINNNYVSCSGAAIYCDADNLKLELKNSSSICNNYAHRSSESFSTDCGGAIYIDNDNASIILDNSSIKNNHARKDGGAIYSNGDSLNITLKNNSSISNNYSETDGGAIFSANNELNIKLTTNSSIADNKADGDGGAICYSNYTDIDAQIVMDSTSKISGNIAGDDGGALYVGGEELSISGGTISNNMCSNEEGQGGGIYFFNDDGSVNGTTFTGNSAYEGGAIYLEEENYTIENCNIRNNSAAYRGGGVFLCNNAYLSGVVNITGNTSESDKKSDNLYLDYSSSEDYKLFETPAAGSVVGISINSTDKSAFELTDEGNHNAEVFLSDDTGWHIEANANGQLSIVKGASTMYTITYHYGDETNTEAVNGKLPDTLPVPDGDFVGWFYDDSFTTQANAGDSIDHNIDLYAKFSQTTTYTLHYHVNDDSTHVYDSTETNDLLPNELWSPVSWGSISAPWLAMYNFVGWFYDDGTFTNEAHGGDAVSGDTDLYACWVPYSTEEQEISEELDDGIDDGETGSVFGESSIGILIAGIVVIVGGVLVCIIVARKRKQSQQ